MAPGAVALGAAMWDHAEGRASPARPGAVSSGLPVQPGGSCPLQTSLPPLSSQLRRQAGVAAGSVVLCPETVQRGKEHPVQHLYGSAWPRSALGAGTVCAAWEPRSTDAGPQGREGRGTALSITAGLGGNRPLIPLSQCHPRVLCGPPASMSPRNLKSSGPHPRLMEGTLFVQPSTGPCARRRGGPSLHRSRPFHSLPVGPLPSVLWRVLRDPAGTPWHAWERPSSLTIEPRKAWKAIGRRRCPSERSPLLRFILCLGGWERAGLFSILVW